MFRASARVVPSHAETALTSTIGQSEEQLMSASFLVSAGTRAVDRPVAAERSMLQMSLDDALASHAHLTDGQDGDHAVELGGLRVIHRQRFSKWLHFLGMRSANGTKIEAIMKVSADDGQTVVDAFPVRTGDVVRVSGPLERRKGKFSIKVETLAVEEAWSDVFGATIFEDHTVPEGNWGRGNVLIQVAGSHAERLKAYLLALHGVHTVAISQVPNTPQERGVLAECADPAALFAALRDDPNVPRVVRRWYLLEGFHATLADAVRALEVQLCELPPDTAEGGPEALRCLPDALRRCLPEALRGNDGRVPVRVATFPRVLGEKVIPMLHAGGTATPQPHGYRAVACVVYVQGRYAAGLAAPSAFHGDLSTAHRNTAGEAVSRAYYKLREVRARCACVPADLSTVAAAIDVGAAPGGWTACLAKAGVRRVVAVDPGALTIPDTPPYDTAVEHMQMTFEAALPQLIGEVIATDADVRFGLYVCDMNQPPATALDFMLQSIPLMQPRAPFVLTFKNPFKKEAQWQRALGAALARLEIVADGVTELHLFANTSHETTVVGTIKEPPPPQHALPWATPEELSVYATCKAAGGSSFKAQVEETGAETGTETGTPLSGDELSLLTSAAEKGQKKKKKKAKNSKKAGGEGAPE